MASYATLADLTDRFGGDELLRWCDRDADGEPDPDYVARLLADAGGEIDSYLSGRYALPLASTEPVLVKIACDLVRLAYQAGGSEVPPVVETAAKQARQMLRDLADGRAVLASTAPAGQPAQGGALFSAPKPVFTDETLAGWLP